MSNERHTIYVYIYFLAFFVAFHQQICFKDFHLFLGLSIKLRNRTLNNQKPELVIRNCQWNYIEVKFINFIAFPFVTLMKEKKP